MIGAQTTLTASVQNYHHFGTSSSTRNDIATIQPGIAALQFLQKNICKCCGIIGRIISEINFIPPSLKIKINKNSLHGNKTTEPLEIRRENLNHFTSNTRPLLSNPVLCFQILWGDLIIMPLIMVILRYTFQSIHLNLSLNLFQIHKPL